MTIPPGFRNGARKVSDLIRTLAPSWRTVLTPEEYTLGLQLRGNEVLYDALVALIQSRIEARARVPEPSEPLECKSMLARDRELQFLLGRLEFIYRSPAPQPVPDNSEQPD